MENREWTCVARLWAALASVLLVALVCTPARGADGSPDGSPDGSRDGRITIAPAVDDELVLHNPDMGWVLYENYPVDPRPGGSSTLANLPQEDFDGVAHVAVMFSWADVERRPGEYDFGDVDHAYDHWKGRGKQIQLRVSAESLLWWNDADPPRGRGIPPHVLEKVAPDRRQRRSESGIGYDVVDARDAAYQSALKAFLAAAARHFADDGARPVTLIDLRGFGLWGEWHSGYRYATLPERREALKSVIDIWTAAFPDHHLALSYSHDPDSPKALWDGPTLKYDEAFTRTYEQFLAWSAFDHARSKANITWRRDGVGAAVYSNQRRLCAEEFARRTRGPFMSEFVDGYLRARTGGEKWLNIMLDDALSLHPNYINLLGWQANDALAFVREQPDMVARGLREMGYRLVPTRITFPAAVTPGESIDVEMTWENRGVGRAMRDFRLVLVIGTQQLDAGPLDTSRWIRGERYHATHRLTVPDDVEPGDYPLHIGLLDPATGKPIALPLKQGAIGTINVSPAAAARRPRRSTARPTAGALP